MRKALLTLFSCALAIALAPAAPAARRSNNPTETDTRVYRAEKGGALTRPSQASAASIVSDFLRSRGHTDATIRSLREDDSGRAARTGLTHLKMSQEVNGLWVYDTYVKAALDARGELLHVVENLAPAPGRVSRPSIGEAAALRAALDRLGIAAGTPDLVNRSGNVATFSKGSIFLAEPKVTKVAIPAVGGTMSTGFLVETWTRKGNLLDETLVNGNGQVVSTERRTNGDSYKIFPESPDAGAQTVVAGGGTESPAGWLYQGEGTTADIAGNNVHAYLDTDNDNQPDAAGGAAPGDGNYLATWNGAVSPDTAPNQDVAVQNLFFHNNVMHDVLYRAGFDEVAGNFQEDNFGITRRGGGDSVNAEAQDGGGTDNANFATPRDGRNPRMQMYLWTPGLEVVVNSPGGLGPYEAAGADFGAQLSSAGVTGDLKLADDGTDPVTDGCEAFPAGFFSGKIALIDRGTCTFVIKVKNAQDAGATAVVIVNNEAGNGLVGMTGTDDTITIGAVSIGNDDGTEAKTALEGGTVNVTAHAKGDLMRDGSLDTDIVYHEYGHGLTWRMIGRMGTQMSGSIGEGMSDVLAVIMNDDDRVGEYSATNALGIRSEPYETYSRTYGDFSATEVHFDGEIYGAIGWRMWQLFKTAGLTRDQVLAYIVDGMNYTPAAPAFEDMRDGILDGMAASGAPDAHACIVWSAFAGYGVGVGASGTVHGSTPVITESFELPSSCVP